MARAHFATADFTPPSLDGAAQPAVQVITSVPDSAAVVGMPVFLDSDPPAELGIGQAALDAAGFNATVGSTTLVPAEHAPLKVAVGFGQPGELDAAAMRNVAAAFARSAAAHERLCLVLPPGGVALSPGAAAQAAIEGALLARYRFDALRSAPKGKPLRSLALVTDASTADEARAGAERGRAFAAAQFLSRDLANSPHSHMSAKRMGEIATTLGAQRGFRVEVFGEDALVEMGIGGLLGVGAGSAEPPQLIRLSYRPASPSGKLAMIGKGIMYDSGGISLKPADQVHAAMKNDMSGAAAILAAFSQLAATGCQAEVTGYLMCTDSMPSGTAMAMGDVITIRGGTTIEVVNTDAEGRLVMADGLVLAHEAGNDAIIDIATLTGASMRALGTEVASVFGNQQGLIDQVKAAADATDEPVWHMPLYKPYRKQLDSPIADMKNLGYGEGGAITAALFLAEFVGDTPWAHIDMAGTALSNDELWKTAGCSGFGARLLLQLALDFTPPAKGG